MEDLRDYRPLKYSKNELSKAVKEIEEFNKMLQSTGRAISIAEFFAQNPKLENRLRNTNIAGIPLNISLCNYAVCAGCCDYVSRLFIANCGIDNCCISTGLDKVIAYNSYKDYEFDWRVAHHTWAEFELNGKEYVADFTSQMVYNKNDYYVMNGHFDSTVKKQGREVVLLQQMTNAASPIIANRILDLTNYNQEMLKTVLILQEVIKDKTKNFYQNQKDVRYLVKELDTYYNKLVENGVSDDTICYAYVVDYLYKIVRKEEKNVEFGKYNFEYFNMPQTEAVISKIKSLSNRDIEDKILHDISKIDRTFKKDYYKVFGPLEYIVNTEEELFSW